MKSRLAPWAVDASDLHPLPLSFMGFDCVTEFVSGQPVITDVTRDVKVPLLDKSNVDHVFAAGHQLSFVNKVLSLLASLSPLMSVLTLAKRRLALFTASYLKIPTEYLTSLWP